MSDKKLAETMARRHREIAANIFNISYQVQFPVSTINVQRLRTFVQGKMSDHFRSVDIAALSTWMIESKQI